MKIVVVCPYCGLTSSIKAMDTKKSSVDFKCVHCKKTAVNAKSIMVHLSEYNASDSE